MIIRLGRRGEEALFWPSAHCQGPEGILTVLNDRSWHEAAARKCRPTTNRRRSHGPNKWSGERPCRYVSVNVVFISPHSSVQADLSSDLDLARGIRRQMPVGQSGRTTSGKIGASTRFSDA